MIETRTNGSMDIYSSHLVDDTDLTEPVSSEVEAANQVS